MKIVILENTTLGNDLNLSGLQNEGELHVFETSSPAEIDERIKDAEILIVNKILIGKQELDIAKKLKLICVSATGYNNIDVAEATRHNVLVANVKGYSTDSVAQIVFSYILAIQSSIYDFNNDVKTGKWNTWDSFSMITHSFTELNGKKLGIIGYGAIGKQVAAIGKAFGMEILIAKRPNIDYSEPNRIDLQSLLKESDVITLHLPLNDSTKNLITKTELNLMKSDAILINTARGGIVNELDLYETLKNKRIKAAATDVLTQEPPRNGHILFDLDNIIITPHIAWTSKESRTRLIEGLLSNIKKFKEGKIDEIKVN